MTRSSRSMLAAGLLVAVAGCSTAATRSGPAGPQPQAAAAPRTPAELARADSGRPPYTAADVRFMQGMIAHHAQAVLMADWAITHGASAGIRTLAGRIAVAQQDEMAFMERWLRERGEAVPDTGAPHAMPGHGVRGHAMPGHDAATASGGLAPGMLTPEQLARLAAARGPEFDALFLSSMIQHHEGALSMVRELFATPGAGQEIHVFQFASEVEADQSTEIDRMRAMLAARQAPSGPP